MLIMIVVKTRFVYAVYFTKVYAAVVIFDLPLSCSLMGDACHRNFLPYLGLK